MLDFSDFTEDLMIEEGEIPASNAHNDNNEMLDMKLAEDIHEFRSYKLAHDYVVGLFMFNGLSEVNNKEFLTLTGLPIDLLSEFGTRSYKNLRKRQRRKVGMNKEAHHILIENSGVSSFEEFLNLIIDFRKFISCFVTEKEIYNGLKSKNLDFLFSIIEEHKDKIDQAGYSKIVNFLYGLGEMKKQFYLYVNELIDLYLTDLDGIVSKYRYLAPNIDIEELMQVGFIGMQHAAERFRPTGVEFSVYMAQQIRQAIIKCNYKEAPFYIPENIRKLFYFFEKAICDVEIREGHELDLNDETVVDMVIDYVEKKNLKKYPNIRKFFQSFITLYYFEASDALAVSGNMGNDEESIIDAISVRSLLARISMNAREQFIFDNRHGIDGLKAYSLDDIGNELNITRERVRQIIENIYSELRAIGL